METALAVIGGALVLSLRNGSLTMTRLAAHILLVTFFGSIAVPCYAAGKSKDDGDGLVSVSFTNADGVEAISLQGPTSTVIARSLTLSDRGKTMRITPHAKGIEMRFGSHVIRATELEFRTMPPIKNLELLEARIKPKH